MMILIEEFLLIHRGHHARRVHGTAIEGRRKHGLYVLLRIIVASMRGGEEVGVFDKSMEVL